METFDQPMSLASPDTTKMSDVVDEQKEQTFYHQHDEPNIDVNDESTVSSSVTTDIATAEINDVTSGDVSSTVGNLLDITALEDNSQMQQQQKTTDDIEEIYQKHSNILDSTFQFDAEVNDNALKEDFVNIQKEDLQEDSNTKPKVESLGAVSADNNSKENLNTELKLKSPFALWLINQNVNKCVLKLIYWENVQNSALSFVGSLIVLLFLYCYTFIQVVTILALSILVVAILYRIGMIVVNAVQKTSAEHPFKNLLEEKIEIPENAVSEWTVYIVQLINRNIERCQELFLVRDFFESFKLGILLWLISYIGSLFSILTLVIYGVVVLYTVPKLYEEKQAEIDNIRNIAHEKLLEAWTKVEDKVPAKIKSLIIKNKKD